MMRDTVRKVTGGKKENDLKIRRNKDRRGVQAETAQRHYQEGCVRGIEGRKGRGT